MGRGKEGQREERGHLRQPGRHGGTAIGRPDLFVWRFAHDLQVRGSRRILDAGCGSGRNSAYVAALGFQVVSLDSAANKVREAKENAPGLADLSFFTGRLESLPFAAQAFDALICTHVMEYMDSRQIEITLNEFRRVLRKQGLLLLVTAAKEGANLDAADRLEGNTYVFRRGDIAVPVHLADQAELMRWLQGFSIREVLRLSLEYPQAATVNATWAVVATR